VYYYCPEPKKEKDIASKFTKHEKKNPPYPKKKKSKTKRNSKQKNKKSKETQNKKHA
jgi:hypothetical protein